MPRFEPWDGQRAAGIIAEHSHLEGATLPILHALQETFGYVYAGAVPLIADALNLSRAEVHGVHHLLPRLPPRTGRPARAEALPRRGLPGDGLRRAARATSEQRLGTACGSTTPTARHPRAGLLPRPLRSPAPSAMVDGQLYRRGSTRDRLDAR